MIFIQQGPAWRPKCTELLERNLVSGIIWDLRNETIEKINEIKSEDNKLNDIVDLADLKIYYKQFPNSLLKKANDLTYMPNYAINRLALRDRSNLEKIVRETLQFQLDNNFSIICIPALYISSFDERIIDAIFDMLLEYNNQLTYNDKKIYLNMLIQESAFNNINQLNDFLNELSSYKEHIKGLYITIDRDNASTIRHDYNPTRLSNLMQMIYAIKLMGLEVLVGYSGIEAVNLIAVGADNIGTGWFHSLRKFNKEDKGLEPKEMRGRQKKRYTSIGFLSELIIDENIWQYNPNQKEWLYNVALNGFSLDTKIKNENLDDISLNETYVEYFEALSNMFEKIEDTEIENRLTKLLEIIDSAIINIDEYNKNNLIGTPLTKKHLESYKTAINDFAIRNFIELN